MKPYHARSDHHGNQLSHVMAVWCWQTNVVRISGNQGDNFNSYESQKKVLREIHINFAHWVTVRYWQMGNLLHE